MWDNLKQHKWHGIWSVAKPVDYFYGSKWILSTVISILSIEKRCAMYRTQQLTINLILCEGGTGKFLEFLR